MDIPAKIYSKFFELFRDKLYARELSTLANQSKPLGEIWKQPLIDEKGRRSKIPFITAQFSVKPLYFYEKYRAAINNPDDNIPFVTYAFVRAYEYLEDVPEEKQYKGKKEQWEDHGKLLLIEFTKQIPDLVTSHNKQEKNVEHTTQIKDPLLEIATNYRALESPTISQLVFDFFNAISQKKYLSAWRLLSPELQEKSIWNSSFKRFEASYSGVEAIACFSPFGFTYSFKQVTCITQLWEKGVMYDLGLFLEKAKIADEEGEGYSMVLDHFDEFIKPYLSNDPYESKLNWIDCLEGKIRNMDKDQFMHPNVQKIYSAAQYELANKYKIEEILPGTIPYNDFFSVSISCTFFENEWLIDELSFYKKSLSQKFYDVIKLADIDVYKLNLDPSQKKPEA